MSAAGGASRREQRDRSDEERDALEAELFDADDPRRLGAS
jgi:hypothetical protein